MTCASSEEFCNQTTGTTFSSNVLKNPSMPFRSSQSNKSCNSERTKTNDSAKSKSSKQRKISHCNPTKNFECPLPPLVLPLPSGSDEENSHSTSHGTLSPVLGSYKQENQLKPFETSTPESAFFNTLSPRNNQSDLIVNVLDKLCSPISSKSKPYAELKRPNKNPSNDRKSSKRLFNGSFNDYGGIRKKKKTSMGESSSHCDSPSYFKMLDVSDNTLNDVWDAAEEFIENKKLDEYKETLNSIPAALMKDCDNVTALQSTSKDCSGNFPISSLYEGHLINSDDNIRATIYSTELVKNSNTKKITLNDLFFNIRELEEANKHKNTNSKKCMQSKVEVLDEIKTNKSNFALNKVPQSVKSETSMCNDSVIISDTQFCQILEAAEMVTNLEDTFIDSSNKRDNVQPNLVQRTINKNIDIKEDVDLNSTVCFSRSPVLQKKFNLFQKENVCDINDSFVFDTSLTKAADYSVIATDSHELLKEDKLINGKNFQTIDKVEESQPYVDKPNVLNIEGFRASSREHVSHKSLPKAGHCLSVEMKIDAFKSPYRKNIPDGYLKNDNKIIDGEFQTNKFDGFQTASGKCVQVSTESLLKAKQLLSDIEVEKSNDFKENQTDILTNDTEHVTHDDKLQVIEIREVWKENHSCEDNIKEFQTSSGQQNISPILEKREVTFNEHKPGVPGFKGFHTASGKYVEVSNESVLKVKKLFSDEYQTEGTVIHDFEKSSRNSLPVNTLNKISEGMDNQNDKSDIQKKDKFETASGAIGCQIKNQPITQCLMEVSSQMVKEAKEIEETCKKYDDGGVNTIHIKGFKTASGKDVEISKDNLEKAKLLFSDDIADMAGSSTSGNQVEVSNSSINTQPSEIKDLKSSPRKNVFQNSLSNTNKFNRNDKSQIGNTIGFETASGKFVKVSSKYLCNAKQLFEEVHKDKDDSAIDFKINDGPIMQILNEEPTHMVKEAKQIEEICRKYDDCGVNAIHMKGFKTASGKDVEISKYNLEKAKLLFSDDMAGSFTCGNQVEVSNSYINTQPSEIKDLEVSPRKKLFENNLNNTDTFNRNDKSQIGKRIGFETASGKLVKVSSKSLRKAKQLFEEVLKDKDDEAIDYKMNAGPITQCLTEETSQMVKEAKEIEEICKKYDDCGSNAINMKGFKTASGKDVEILKDNLEKAKLLFSDDMAGMVGCINTSGNQVEVSDNSNNTTKLFADNDCTKSLEIKDLKAASRNKLHENTIKNDNDVIGNDKLRTRKRIGFETVSGKFVKVSSKALREAKQLFEEGKIGNDFPNGRNIDAEPHIQPLSYNSKSYSQSCKEDLQIENICREYDDCTPAAINVKTLHDDKVNVSKEHLEKANLLLNNSTRSESNFKGFSTASGKCVEVSNEALLKAKKLLADDYLNGEAKDNDIQVPSSNCHDSSLVKTGNLIGNVKSLINKGFGFETASGKFAKVSTKSLLKAKRLFEDTYKSEEDESDQIGYGTIMKMSKGFIDNTNHIYKEQQNNIKVHKGKNNYGSDLIKSPFGGKSLHSHCEPTIMSMAGFKTASGMDVHVSKDNFEKAKMLFDVDKEDASDIKGVCTVGRDDDKVLPNKVLLKSRQQFGDECSILKSEINDTEATSENFSHGSNSKHLDKMTAKDKSQSGKIKGFETASGKLVKISEESLLKAKQLFNDVSNEQEGTKYSQACNRNSGNNNSRSFKDNDFVASENEGGRDDNQITATNLIEPPHNDGEFHSIHMQGFQTASGKNVEVSKDHFEKAKLLFDDANSDMYDSKEDSTNILGKASQSCKSFTTENSSNVDTNYLKQKRVDVKTINNTVLQDKSIENTKKIIKIKKLYIENSPVSHSLNGGNRKIPNDSLHKARQLFFDANKTPTIKSHSYTNMNPKSILKRLRASNVSQQSSKKSVAFNDMTETNSCEISDDDLNLLNLSMSYLSNHENQQSNSLKTMADNGNDNKSLSFLSNSMVSEISESLAAIIADDECNPPFLLEPCVSSPSTIFDRNVNLPALSCYQDDVSVVDKQLSPILGHPTSFHTYDKSVTKSIARNISNEIDTPPSKCKGFKPPYATSTPNDLSHSLKTKRMNEELSCYTPPFKKGKISNDLEISSENISSNILQLRKKYAVEQEKQIKEKISRKKSTKPCKGSYLLRKQLEQSKRLQDLTNYKPLQMPTAEQLINLDVKTIVANISASNAVDFKFIAHEYYSIKTCSSNVRGLPVGDGAVLILDDEGKAGVDEVTRSFLSSPAVDPALISPEWIKNHYKWLVLKFASMERMFPDHFANRYLTPNNLMLQLKYRYDREIDRCQRSALRKVLEKDEHPSKPMILFVSDILQVGEEKKELKLSDGWYSIKSTIDHEMHLLIKKKRVMIGTKLLIVGAEMIGNEDGYNPLEVPADVRLKASTNSIRRVRWYGHLGFYHNTLPVSRISDVLGRGGAVQALSAVVVRTYPILFMEKCQDGKKVIRGERAEQVVADKYQVSRQQSAEVILSQLQRNLETTKTKCKRPVTKNSIKQAKDIKELYALLEDVDDIGIFQDILSKEQLNQIIELKQQQSSTVQHELQEKLTKQLNEKISPRMVTRMLKVRLADPLRLNNRSALLTVWSPSDDVMSLLEEGNNVVLHNVSASGYSRYGDLQLTAGRQTRYELVKRCPVSRTTTTLNELTSPDFKAQFSEIDIVGILVDTGDVAEDNSKQLVYMADSNYNFIMISFWTDVKETGYGSVLAPGALVAVSNLHWQSNLVSWSLPSAFATEVSVFSQHPRQSHLQEALTQLREQLVSRNMDAYKNDCVKKIKGLIAQRNSGGLHSTLRTEGTSTPVSGSKSPLESNQLVTPPSSSKSTSSACERKIEWLERFGEPPPVLPLCTSTPSRLRKQFCPPMKKTK